MHDHRKKNSGLTGEIRIKRCYGCGAILQSEEKKGTGFISKERLAMEEEQLCERCYRLRHYNDDQTTPFFNEDFASILKKARETNSLIVYVLDVFSFEGSLLPQIEEHLSDKLLVLLNKRDVLPQSYNDMKIIEDAKVRLNSFKVHPRDILLISSLKNYNLDELMSKIDKLREGKDVYFVGASQVGKSSIINCLLKNYKNTTRKFITTSPYPGTTIDVINIPLDNESYIYDTPGIYNGQSVLNNVERQILKYIIPRNEIKPRIYQTKEEQSFILGALARVDFVKGPKTNFTFVLSNEVVITRCKLEKADNTFTSLAITHQCQPASSKVKGTNDLVIHEYEVQKNERITLVIAGLGAVSFEANGQKIRVLAPKNVLVSLQTNTWYR